MSNARTNADLAAVIDTTGGNVGIGTDGPDSLLHVGTGTNTDGTDVTITIGGDSANNRQSLITKKIQSDDRALQIHAGAGSSDEDIRFFSDSTTERMRIDSSGNVGVGTTSIAAEARMVVDGGRFYINSDDQYGLLLQNAGTSGGFIGTTAANTLNFYNSSGTERMRIDSDGDVGIGTTSATSKLHVYGSSGAGSRIHIESGGAGLTSFDGSGSGLLMTAGGMNTTSKFTPAIQFGSTDSSFTTTNPKVGAAINGMATEAYGADTDGGMGLSFHTRPNNDGTDQDVTERVRIDQDGNVVIFENGELRFADAGNSLVSTIKNQGASGTSMMAFLTGSTPTERMRVTQDGDVLIGRTSTGNSASDHGIQLYGTGYIYVFSNGSGNTDVIRVYDSGGNLNAAIDADGDYHDLSDAKYKENIAPSERGLSDIMGLNVVSFDWNNKDRHETSGFIAQEMEQAIPELVARNEDTGDLSIKTNNLIPMLTKALQEAVTRIETLEAEVAALKGA